MEASPHPLHPAAHPGLRLPALLLGFAFGGFFDGILLHQVLQWHHLLSGLQADALRDMRLQILADGLFHLLMYLVAAVGLWRLWRARALLSHPRAARDLPVAALAGIGLWHVVDTLVSHWLLGIHRVRMDTPYPLAWDLLWLAAFGLVPLALAWWWGRRPPAQGGGGSSRATALSLAGACMLAGAVAAAPPPGANEVLVVFGPGTTAARAMGAIGDVGGRVVWVDRSGSVWAVRSEQPAQVRALYAHNAWLVGSAPVSLGCISWTLRR